MRASGGPSNALLLGNLQHAHLRVANRVREIIHVHALHIGLALLEIEPLHVILLSLVNVNRLRMHGRERRREINFANHFRLAFVLSRHINDYKIVGRHRSQAHRIRRIRLLHPVPVSAAAMEISRLRQSLAHLLQVNAPDSFIG